MLWCSRWCVINCRKNSKSASNMSRLITPSSHFQLHLQFHLNGASKSSVQFSIGKMKCIWINKWSLGVSGDNPAWKWWRVAGGKSGNAAAREIRPGGDYSVKGGRHYFSISSKRASFVFHLLQHFSHLILCFLVMGEDGKWSMKTLLAFGTKLGICTGWADRSSSINPHLQILTTPFCFSWSATTFPKARKYIRLLRDLMCERPILRS